MSVQFLQETEHMQRNHVNHVQRNSSNHPVVSLSDIRPPISDLWFLNLRKSA